jgi:hypothetical protein
MERRLVIAASFLVLALVALAGAGLVSPSGAPAADVAARLPQPSPCPMPELAQASTVLPSCASVALELPMGMSGEFADTHYA